MSIKLHPAQIKQRKSKKLLQRALSEMVAFLEDDFSYPSIIEKMKAIATQEKLSDRIVFKSSSTISHSEEYKSMIRQAVIEVSEKKAKTINWDTDLKLSEHELKLRMDLLIRKAEQMKDELDYHKELLKKVDSRLIDEKSEPITNLILDDKDNVYKNILKNLIEVLHDAGLMQINKEGPQEPYALWLYLVGGSRKIMNQDLMVDLGLELVDGEMMTKSIE